MSSFIGRETQLAALDRLLGRVRDHDGPRPGRALLMRGRRRVGKSRLVEEFVARTRVPHVFVTASTRSTAEELALFSQEVIASNLPGAELFRDVTPRSWDAALRLLADALPADGPAIVVLDELPYLIASDPGFEGTLQKLFDRELSRRRVLLIGIGSDLSMMEALGDHGRPFYQRATEMVVPALTPLEVATMLGMDAPAAFDAYLVTGGLPLVCGEWPKGMQLWAYLDQAVDDPTSALLVSGERALAAEFPAEVQARSVLTSIGAGERSFANINRHAGGLHQTSLSRSLTELTARRVVAADRPLSVKPSKETRYRVADPYLRFWLAFLAPHLPEVERGRGDRVAARIRTSWTSWRGRAIEPVVRESLARLPSDDRPSGADVIGGYWTRSNDPEIDVVAADRGPVARTIAAVGSIKWLESQPFDDRDLARLILHRSQLPGATDSTPLLAVARAGCAISGVRAYGPQDLLAAWR